MWFKEILKKDFFESENKLNLRYKSAKTMLIFFILLFFTSFYFVWAGFHRDFFINYISVFYIFLVITIILYIYLYFKKTFDQKLTWVLLYIFVFLLFIIFVFLLLPLFVNGWIHSFIV